jgi:virulence-associated protein VapD
VCFVSAPVFFDQCVVDLALIEQACSGPCSTKHENHLTFHCQLKETHACCATDAEHKEAHKKSLTAHLEVPLADCLAFTISISATLIAPKPILIDFKKIQGEDYVKVFQLKIKAIIKQLTPLAKLFDQFADCVDVSKFHQLKHFLDHLLNLQNHLSECVRTILPDQ